MKLRVVTEAMEGTQCRQQTLPLAVFEEERIQIDSTPLAKSVNAISYLHVTIQHMLPHGTLGA